jgi:hypothetical protein
MQLSTLWAVPEPALIHWLAESLRARQITQVPEWLTQLFVESELETLTTWWYHQAAYSIYHYARTPMLKPRMAPSIKGDAMASMIDQFAAIGWLQFDRTGIMLVSRDFDAMLADLRANCLSAQ